MIVMMMMRIIMMKIIVMILLNTILYKMKLDGLVQPFQEQIGTTILVLMMMTKSKWLQKQYVQ